MACETALKGSCGRVTRSRRKHRTNGRISSVDIAEALGKETETANTMHDAWRWKNVKKKTDKEDALKLAKLSAVRQLPTVHTAEKEVREKRALIKYRQRLVRYHRCVSIEPKVALKDVGMLLLVGWGTDNPVYDIGPTPFGDGIVDSKDLMVLAEHGAFLTGDANFDRVVNFLDLVELAKNWLQDTNP
ncbi:MAG: hypothetical protein JSU70_04685 [Phycisphaerales bacterium]|nr:MAG: hypothetical protein JSU70_04685 [Phycisphaerales bacterium]